MAVREARAARPDRDRDMSRVITSEKSRARLVIRRGETSPLSSISFGKVLPALLRDNGAVIPPFSLVSQPATPAPRKNAKRIMVATANLWSAVSHERRCRTRRVFFIVQSPLFCRALLPFKQVGFWSKVPVGRAVVSYEFCAEVLGVGFAIARGCGMVPSVLTAITLVVVKIVSPGTLRRQERSLGSVSGVQMPTIVFYAAVWGAFFETLSQSVEKNANGA
jgi:hypothetical protein